MHSIIHKLTEQLDHLNWSMQIEHQTAPEFTTFNSHRMYIELVVTPEQHYGSTRVPSPRYLYEICIYRLYRHHDSHPTKDLVIEITNQSDTLKIISYEAKSFIYALEDKMGRPFAHYDINNILSLKE